MSDEIEAYLGEIRIFAGNYAPIGWAVCDGALLPVEPYASLFAILDTKFGGDGEDTFGLPDLTGCSAVGMGLGPGLANVLMGESLGAETVKITDKTSPPHTHPICVGTQVSGLDTPSNKTILGMGGRNTAKGIKSLPAYASTAVDASQKAMNGHMVEAVQGGSEPHENRQPFIAMNFIICISGGDYPYVDEEKP